MKTEKEPLPNYSVYVQSDGGLLPLKTGEEVPEHEDDPVWEGEAINPQEAIAKTRKAVKEYAKAHAARSEDEPNSEPTQKAAEEATNERLGIDTAELKKKKSKKKSVAKKSVAKKKAVIRKTAKKPVRKSRNPF